MSEKIYDLAITGRILKGDHFIDDGTLLINSGKIVGITSGAAEQTAKKIFRQMGIGFCLVLLTAMCIH